MSNIGVVQAVYTGMAARDVEQILANLSAECVITQDARLPWGGRFVGHDGFLTFGAALLGSIDSAVTTEAIFEADDEVIQVGRTRGTARASGKPFDVAEVHRWKVRNGKVTEAHFAIDTTVMLDALTDRPVRQA
jgi:ketosteroid isomerase-like protein